MLHFAIKVGPKCEVIVRNLRVDILRRSAYVTYAAYIFMPGLPSHALMQHELLQVGDTPHYLLVGDFKLVLSIFRRHVLRHLLRILQILHQVHVLSRPAGWAFLGHLHA